MPIYPIDAVRNARIDHSLELILQEVREDLSVFPFSPDHDVGDAQEVIEAYDMARPRLNVLLNLAERTGTAQRADISTGIGLLPAVFRRAGIDIVATEKDPNVARYAAAHGTPVYRYEIGKDVPPFEAQSLDLLVFSETLEHLKSAPIGVLKELSSLLRPGGQMLLTTPNVARLSHLEALAAGENFLEPFPADLPPGQDATDSIEHVREYSIREVVEAIEAGDLAVDQILMTSWGESGYNPPTNPYCNDIIVVEAHRYRY